MHITVIGAGLVGLSTAFFLHRAGHQVALIEHHSQSAQETSFANGGQMSAFYCEPFASPRLRHILRAAVHDIHGSFYYPVTGTDETEPLKEWLAAAEKAGHPDLYQQSALDLFQLALFNQHALRTVLESLPINTLPAHKKGILSLYRTEEGIQHGLSFAKQLAQHGLRYERCSAEECQKHISCPCSLDALHGALYMPEDASANSYQYAQILTSYLVQQNIPCHWHTTVEALVSHHERITALRCRTPAGTITHPVDHVVLCTANQTTQFFPELARVLQGIAGYSLNFPYASEEEPGLSLIDQERKIVITPLREYLRVAGLCDLGPVQAEDTWTRYQRQKCLLSSLYDWFPSYRACSEGPGTLWRAYRPVTADSVPMIGCIEYSNVYINVGHGFWGWTTCCASAQLLMRLMAEPGDCTAVNDSRLLDQLKKRWRPQLQEAMACKGHSSSI